MTNQYYLNLAPFKFLLTTDVSHAIQNLKLIYGELFTPYNEQQIPDYHIKIVKSQGMRGIFRKQVRFLSDEYEPFKPVAFDQAYAFLEWGLNYIVAENEYQYVIIHSGVLEKNGQAILFPAPPGSGKSTLTSFLAYNGWRLLSDEMALIQANTDKVIPAVRPICLKNNSIQLIKNMLPQGKFSSIAYNTHKGDIIHLAPPDNAWENLTAPATIKSIVFPKYTPNTQLDVYALNKTQAFTQLAQNAFNYGVLEQTGFQTLTQIIDNIDCYEIHYNDLNEVKHFLETEIIDQ